jgi:dihydrofolate reductase
MANRRTSFTLIAVTSRNGFIAGPNNDPPGLWASPEEQVRFAETVSALDWAFIGRLTHHLAWRPDRRRVVFSRSFRTPVWRHPKRLWVDPDEVPLQAILATVGAVHPAEHCGILGGLGVHDWFAERGLIDAADITIEPFSFEHGLPLLSRGVSRDPLASMAELGLVETDAITLNARGTCLHRFARPAP